MLVLIIKASKPIPSIAAQALYCCPHQLLIQLRSQRKRREIELFVAGK